MTKCTDSTPSAEHDQDAYQAQIKQVQERCESDVSKVARLQAILVLVLSLVLHVSEADSSKVPPEFCSLFHISTLDVILAFSRAATS